MIKSSYTIRELSDFLGSSYQRVMQLVQSIGKGEGNNSSFRVSYHDANEIKHLLKIDKRVRNYIPRMSIGFEPQTPQQASRTIEHLESLVNNEGLLNEEHEFNKGGRDETLKSFRRLRDYLSQVVPTDKTSSPDKLDLIYTYLQEKKPTDLTDPLLLEELSLFLRDSKLTKKVVDARKRVAFALAKANEGLVYSTLKRMGIYENNPNYEDFERRAQEGLMRAIVDFDPFLGYELSTYACTSIIQHIRKEMQKQQKRAEREKPDHYQGENSEIRIEFPDRTPMPDEITANDEMRERVNKALNSLSKREGEILRRRFGFYGEEETLKQVGIRVGLTKERIRQIEARALRELRQKVL